MHYPSSFFLSEAFFSRESCAEVNLFLDPKQTVPSRTSTRKYACARRVNAGCWVLRKPFISTRSTPYTLMGGTRQSRICGRRVNPSIDTVGGGGRSRRVGGAMVCRWFSVTEDNNEVLSLPVAVRWYLEYTFRVHVDVYLCFYANR